MTFYIHAHSSTTGEVVYVRPKPPTKAEGRRGTRKAWKREFPPGNYWLVTTTEHHSDGSQTVRQHLTPF